MNFDRIKENNFPRIQIKEDFLQYIWKFQLFEKRKMQTVLNKNVQILKTGIHNRESGPDFFNGLIEIGNQLWAGNIEIHIKSSDWYVHKHEQDANYDSVILHVVWEYDVPVFYSNQKEIPTIELRNIVNNTLLKSYKNLFLNSEKWILCENMIKDVDSFILESWLNRLYFERLEDKSKFIFSLLKETNNDWEATLFQLIAQNFGLKLNKDAFFNLARSFDYSVLRKCSNSKGEIETLLFGQAGFFKTKVDDVYHSQKKIAYEYLSKKYKLSAMFNGEFQFFRLRPNNFPTLRISQLAMLYELHGNLFSIIIELENIEDFYEIFQVKTSSYWYSHYVFGKESKKRVKRTSKKFVDLILINVILPIKYAYNKYHNKNFSNDLEMLIESLAPENNNTINMYKNIGVIARNAMSTQGLLELKSNYCNKKRCLECSVGLQIIKNKQS